MWDELDILTIYTKQSLDVTLGKKLCTTGILWFHLPRFFIVAAEFISKFN